MALNSSISLKVMERVGWNEWTPRNTEWQNFKKCTIKYWVLWMMSNFIIINTQWPTHWLGEVLLHDEICKQIETRLLAGTSCRERWGQNMVFFVTMEQFQPLQRLYHEAGGNKSLRHTWLLLTLCCKRHSTDWVPSSFVPSSQYLSSTWCLTPSSTVGQHSCLLVLRWS